MTCQPAPAPLRDLIRQARDAAGLTQEDLAEIVGMSQRWVSALERGEVIRPKMVSLRRLSDALRIDLTDLVIAAEWAKTRADAQRIVERSPPPKDPLRDVVFRGYEGLTDEGRRFVAEQVKLAQRLFGTEDRRGDDATEDGPNAEAADRRQRSP